MGRKGIMDDYEVTWGDYYTQGRDGFFIGCEVGGVSDSILEDIKSIK